MFGQTKKDEKLWLTSQINDSRMFFNYKYSGKCDDKEE